MSEEVHNFPCWGQNDSENFSPPNKIIMEILGEGLRNGKLDWDRK